MKKCLALLLVFVFLLGLVACTDNQPGTPTTTAPSATTITTPEQAGKVKNMLTGQYDMKQGDDTRPVAIMVPNDSIVIGYQVEIDKADFYLECETEGAIPRLMTVFANANRVPEKYGPIRSARSPFVHTAKQLGFVLTFSGATNHVLNKIKTLGLEVMNASYTPGKTFWRDSYLSAHVTNYHNLVTGGNQLAERIDKVGYSTTALKTLPFEFGEKKGDAAATTFQVNTTPSHRATFKYDSKTGLYGKNIGKIDSYKPHKTAAGNQIKVSNVLVLYAPKFVEKKDSKYTWYDFEMGSGSGYLFSGGTYRKVNYTRSTDELKLTEQDGSPLIFAEGKIYMVLADKTLESKQIVQ